MEWKSIEKDGYPQEQGLYLVSNSKGWMYSVRAWYRSEVKLFLYYNPDHRDTLILNVTHYLHIPDCIRE